MKIKAEFSPIKITIETKEEFRLLMLAFDSSLGAVNKMTQKDVTAIIKMQDKIKKR